MIIMFFYRNDRVPFKYMSKVAQRQTQIGYKDSLMMPPLPIWGFLTKKLVCQYLCSANLKSD